MYESILAVLSLLLLLACNKPEVSREMPDCIQKILEDSTYRFDPILEVRVQNWRGELTYWLNTDARHYDGVEFIVNNQCDTICTYCGFCEPRPCSKKYPLTDWVTIWKK